MVTYRNTQGTHKHVHAWSHTQEYMGHMARHTHLHLKTYIHRLIHAHTRLANTRQLHPTHKLWIIFDRMSSCPASRILHPWGLHLSLEQSHPKGPGRVAVARGHLPSWSESQPLHAGFASPGWLSSKCLSWLLECHVVTVGSGEVAP